MPHIAFIGVQVMCDDYHRQIRWLRSILQDLQVWRAWGSRFSLRWMSWASGEYQFSKTILLCGEGNTSHKARRQVYKLLISEKRACGNAGSFIFWKGLIPWRNPIRPLKRRRARLRIPQPTTRRHLTRSSVRGVTFITAAVPIQEAFPRIGTVASDRRCSKRGGSRITGALFFIF